MTVQTGLSDNEDEKHGALARVRRGDAAQDDELQPLALSSDSDTMDETPKSPDNTFQPPHPSNNHVNGFANGDIYKEKVREETDEPETRCGYWSCRPDALQKCNNPKALLLFLSCFSLAQGFVVNGINNVNTTSVERRFQLPSSQVGMISSSYDFSAAILGIFISFMGSGRQKARWLTMACFIMAVGSFVMAMPHFVTGKYEWGQDVALTCNMESMEGPSECNADSELQSYLYVLILGQLLHGLGGTTLYTVGVGLIDDSVPAVSSPMYIGILYAFATLGPALGYIIGGQMLNIYVDFDTIPHSEIRLTTEDPRWVGAWWVGFLVASGLFLAAAIPISMYGAELPSAKKVRLTRVSEMHGDDGSVPVALASKTKKLSDLKYLPGSVLHLLKIPPFMLITFAGATEGMITSGFSTFMPKFIQNQFGVTPGWASMLTGFMAVPGAAGGQFFGGYICKRFKLKVKGCIRVGIICCCLTVGLSAALWLKCSHRGISGVTRSYTNTSIWTLPSLTAGCNEACQCHTELYEPVCDSAGNQYFSPCHAGCMEQSLDKESYNSCSCVPTNDTSVQVGKCDAECSSMYIFLPLTFLAIFLLFMPSPPVVAATLRCIHDSHRTFGLGFKWFIVRLLGTVPGPIIFGAIIDSTCVIWREKCDENASCWIYDDDKLSRNFFVMVLGFKIVSITLFILAHQLYKPPAECISMVEYKVQDDSALRTDSVSSAVTILTPDSDTGKLFS